MAPTVRTLRRLKRFPEHFIARISSVSRAEILYRERALRYAPSVRSRLLLTLLPRWDGTAGVSGKGPKTPSHRPKRENTGLPTECQTSVSVNRSDNLARKP